MTRLKFEENKKITDIPTDEALREATAGHEDRNTV